MDIIRDPSIIEGYLTDASNTRGHADALVRPRSAAEVAEVLARCQQTATSVTVTARRTSTTGAPVPRGGWLLSTELLDKIYAVDEVGAGALLGAYQQHAAEAGWLFPPDPTSRHECTVGAAIACNASGARSFRYGPTRPWIKALEVVLPDGQILPHITRDTPIPTDWPTIGWQEPTVKTAAGYFPADNLLDLMIGQEGTLGVITRAWTRLVPLPAGVLSLIAFFDDLEGCLAFVEVARQGAGRRGQPAAPGALNPCAIEFFDHHSLALVRSRVPDIPSEARCALFIEVEHDGEAPVEAWWEALMEGGALEDVIVADDEQGRRRLQAVRHAIPAGVNEQVVANGMPKVGTDFSVPDGALVEMMARYAETELPHILFGHIGDNHLHLNLLPTSGAELAAARERYVALARAAVALGGTVSAEHGIGKIKRALLAEMLGDEVIGRFRAL
ncbi:MAG: D-lactate dehydrogenase (cytochrome), partial [Myxococcota bacterium]